MSPPIFRNDIEIGNYINPKGWAIDPINKTLYFTRVLEEGDLDYLQKGKIQISSRGNLVVRLGDKILIFATDGEAEIVNIVSGEEADDIGDKPYAYIELVVDYEDVEVLSGSIVLKGE